jgi:hypothetical protein
LILDLELADQELRKRDAVTREQKTGFDGFMGSVCYLERFSQFLESLSCLLFFIFPYNLGRISL